jgi:hypothetical protein
MNMNDLFKTVMELNLDSIKAKLMHAASGEGWSREKADAVEMEYRRFLCLMKLYPTADTSPLVDVDTFWHYHILDTTKYAADCEKVFGYFLHHYPYVGMGGGDDEQFRIDSGERMRELYEATFGEPYPVPAVEAGEQARETAYCGGPWREPARTEAIAAATAYCGGPWREPARTEAIAAATAYCGGPWRAPARTEAIAAATAYCGGPWRAPARTEVIAAATAYCGGPWGGPARTGAIAAATAYCGGPWREPAGRGNAAAGRALAMEACAA